MINHSSASFNFNKMKVISSLEKFIFDHISIDFFSKASAAKLISFFFKKGAIIFTTYSFYRYYHTPSDAIRMNLSED